MMKRFYLLLFSALFITTNAAIVDRYPVIQSPDEHSVVIAWTSASAYVGSVHWGTTSGSLTNVVADASSTQRHAITITGLQPNTQYYYQASGGSFTSSVEYFYTAKPDSVKHVEFLAYGDCGFNNSQQDQMSALMAAQNHDFALVVGDVDQLVGNAYDDDYFKHYTNILKHTCHFTAIGNHDIITNNTNYTDAFVLPHNNPANSELYYSFTWGNAKFIALDGNIDYTSGSAQYTWLQNELKCNNSEWLFVFFHQPPWTNDWDPSYYIPLTPFFLYQGNTDMRTSLVPLFEQYHVDFVLNGHAHDYQRGIYNGVRYFITGGGGTSGPDTHTNNNAPNIQFESAINNYMKFIIDGDQVHFNTYDGNNAIVDSATVTKSFTPFASHLVPTATTCNGTIDGAVQATVAGPRPAYTYHWSTGATTGTLTGIGAGNYQLTITDANGCTYRDSATVTQPTPLVSSITKTDIGCNGNNTGSALVAASGSTSPYTYTWNTGATVDSISGVQGGSYNVTITDAHGCLKNDSVTIQQASTFTITLAAQNVKCHGDASGQVVVSPSAPSTYNYVWSNNAQTDTAKNLLAGTYRVTVTNLSGCSVIDSVIITEPATAVTAQLSTQNATCPNSNNGSVQLNVSGGTPPYIYSYTNTTQVDSLAPGAYGINVTDNNGCLLSRPFSITALGGHSTLNLYTPDGVTTICQGDSLSIDPMFGFSNFVWSNGATTSQLMVYQTGSYYAQAQDSFGCITNSDTVNITVNNLLSLQIADVVNGHDVDFTASDTTQWTYIWLYGDGTVGDNVGPHPSHTYADSGDYTVLMVTQQLCGNDTATKLVHIAADTAVGVINLYSEYVKISVSPNPFSTETEVKLTGKDAAQASLKLYSPDGKLLRSYNPVGNGIFYIERADLSNGAYLLQINNGTLQQTIKLMVW